ncbi:MAG: hypothetical protein ACXVBH_09245 [Flavisolibacter sp.]
MNKFFLILLCATCFLSCKNKKLDSTKAYFSVVDYLNGEVKKVDSLPLHFLKITSVDSTSDTTTATKADFDKYAKEFLTIPDIASPRKMDDYTEANSFDEIMNTVLLMYTAKHEDDVVRNETIMMDPDESGNTHVKTILVTTQANNADSSVEKNLTWHTDKRFQVVTKTSTKGQPEKINTIIISWE